MLDCSKAFQVACRALTVAFLLGPSVAACSSSASLSPGAVDGVQASSLAAKASLTPTKARYTITAITFPSYLTAGLIAGIDGNGDMAGYGSETDNDAPDCVYYNGQTLLDLSGIGSGDCAFQGMNAAGVAAGQYYDPSGELNYGVTYAQGQFSEINTPVNGFLAINDKNVTVANLPSGGLAVYSLLKSKILYDLYDSREHCAMSVAYEINDHGVVLGYDHCQGSGTTRYETVSNHDVFNYFQLPAGYVISSRADRVAFNSSAQIALNKSSGGHAYLWATSGTSSPEDLGALTEDPTGTYYVTALSAKIAVGVTSDGYSWVWTLKQGMQNLADLLPPNSYGWVQPEALDARGEMGCIVSTNQSVWLYLKR